MKLEFGAKKLVSDDVVTNLRSKLNGLGVGFLAIGEPIPGPIVTAYPVTLHPSTPLNKLMNKSEDIALACGVESVYLKREGAKVLVYIPNKEKKIVNFMDAIMWYMQNETAKSMNLPILLGTDTQGNNSVLELTKQPHILISGSTGSGKSIFESNIIASLCLMKSTNELEIYLVDTKMVDLPLFSKVPHVLDIAQEVTDFYRLITELNGIVANRNKRLAKAGVRNIQEYNKQFPNRKLPYIILIIDELADLLDKDRDERLANGKDHVEPKAMDSLRKLLQICRAAGIHVIACTQRTSGDIVSALAKTNLPTRIALKLPSKKDSEFILDQSGAENLLGNGDMLVKESIGDSVKRYHSPFVRLEDIKSVIEQMDMIKQSMNLEV